MSNLATADRLRQATSQLPVSWYCDPAHARARAAAACSRRGPGYVGHELMVPNAGDYYALAWRDNAQALVRNARRRRAPVEHLPASPGDHAQGPRQRAEHRLPDAPLDLRSQGRAARRAAFRRAAVRQARQHAAQELERPAVRRPARRRARPRRRSASRRTSISRATCSTGSRSTSATTTGRPSSRSISRTTTSGRSIRASASSSPATTCAGSSATATRCRRSGVNNALAKPGTKTYERWHKAVLDYYRGEPPKHGAIWVTIYPNIMLEWYAHVLIVSTLIPRGVDRTTNVVEFYYPEEIALFEREFVEAEQAAYMETAAEDDEIAERMDAGRRALYKPGAARSGPTSRRWKTACSTSTSSCGASWPGPEHGGVAAATGSMKYTTLDLDRRSRAASRRSGVRHRRLSARSRRRRRGRARVPQRAHSRRAVRASRPRPVRREDRQQRPPSAARCRSARDDARPRSASTPRSRSSPTIRTPACGPRACGGCCAGSATTPSRCSTAARQVARRRTAGDDRERRRRRPRRSSRTPPTADRLGRRDPAPSRTTARCSSSTRARPSATAARSSRSIRSPGTSRARATARTPRISRRGGTFKSAARPALPSSRRCSAENRRRPSCINAGRASPRATTCWRWRSRACRLAPLSGVVERMDRRSGAAGRAGKRGRHLDAELRSTFGRHHPQSTITERASTIPRSSGMRSPHRAAFHPALRAVRRVVLEPVTRRP